MGSLLWWLWVVALAPGARALGPDCTSTDIRFTHVGVSTVGATRTHHGKVPAWFNTTIKGAGGTVDLKWTCTMDIWPHLTRSGTARATATADVTTAFRVTAKDATQKRPWPGAAAAAKCAAAVTVSDLDITGAPVPSAIEKLMAGKIGSIMETKLCEEATSFAFDFTAADAKLETCQADAVKSEAAVRRHAPRDPQEGVVTWSETVIVRAGAKYVVGKLNDEFKHLKDLRVPLPDASLTNWTSPYANVSVALRLVAAWR